jgi:cyclopropane-fatty-acyl-phospholipid synthase
MIRQTLIDHLKSRWRFKPIPLRIRLWNGVVVDLGATPTVTVHVASMAGLRCLLDSTLDNLGKGYVEGSIDIEGRMMDVVAIAVELAAHPDNARYPWRRKPRLAWHDKKMDAQAIAYHYDLSNEFYGLWLDRDMVYSCGYFHEPTDSLDVAQTRKIDHILRKLKIRRGDRLLDIGCGWGALARRAAGVYGARVLGITLSQSQHEYARERIAREGLQDRCEVVLEDYRDITGRFDRITSVGMFEHVGLKNMRDYFSRMRILLDTDGVAMNHGITSTDADSRETPFGGGRFIENYVFPHGELAHIGLVLTNMSRAGLEIVDVENLRRHYALTLHHWVERFEAAAQECRTLAGERRWRIWRAYLAGCAHGFAQNWLSIHQVLVVRDRAGIASPLPLTRDYMYGGPAK